MARTRRPNKEQLAVWRGFLQAYVSVIRRLDHDLRTTHRLPLEWYDVLVQLAEADGCLSMGQLAQAVLISPSNCSRLVDRMVEAGLVERRQAGHDARVKNVTMTPIGRATLRRAAPTHLAGVHRHFTGFLDDYPLDQQWFYRQVIESTADWGEARPPAPTSSAESSPPSPV